MKVSRTQRGPKHLLKNMYSNAKNKILLKGHTSDAFSVDHEVRQGCVLSPILFPLVLDEAMVVKNDSAAKGLKCAPFTKLNDLEYVDSMPTPALF